MSIREVNAVAITDAVEELCIRANTQLPPDVKQALDNAHAAEPWPLARQTLELLQQNLCVAAEKDLPICQDTGMACVFIELGQDVHINGNLDEAVNEGVRRGYEKAYLRKSITADPLQRVNTGDNTPAFLTVHLVPGDVCKITVAPKGAGSENMSRLTMLRRLRFSLPDHAQTCRWRAGRKRLCDGNRQAGGGQPLPAHCAGHWHWRQL